ncbi:OprD family outer membrane porin [Acinetobacter sp. WZC-1]|uniref:OprD family outer membrane porin n=1 Tax=Acinetobacter sp. WZC-1 TaxID=3459034 RepID=UPI00403DB593
MNTWKWLPILAGIGGISPALSAENIEAEILLRNLYAERDARDNQPDRGSWSQGITAKLKGSQQVASDLDVLFTGSVQYAQRLSQDKHLNDMILPFDTENQKQAENYNKVAGSIGLKYQQHQLSWGEQWLDTPLATTDYSRQLVTIYDGVVYKGKFPHNTELEMGRINKFSPRNEGKFRKLSVKNTDSDGLNYVDVNVDATQKTRLNLYYGNLIDLYDQFSVGLQYQQNYADFLLTSKFRFYSSQESGDEKLGNVDSQYYGFLQELNYGAHTFGMGYQKLEGDTDFPMLDGAVPVLDYINWTQGTFNRAGEASVHLIYRHNLDRLVPGLNFAVKYINGDDFSTQNRQDARESQMDFILNYKVQQGMFKGLAFQWLNINYRNNFGGDYSENRVITTYRYTF